MEICRFSEEEDMVRRNCLEDEIIALNFSSFLLCD
jgi:hypothetical protein